MKRPRTQLFVADFWRSCLAAAILLIAPTDAPAAEVGSSQARFAFKPNDVVVFTGGAGTVGAEENGCLETLLTIGCSNLNVRFRNLGWEGDTVYEQRRDLNFGPWTQQFKKAGATVIFAQFGQMEALPGDSSFPQFVTAYEKLLDEFSKQTDRIILVSPFPFDSSLPPLPDLSLRNDDLQRFVDAIRQIASRRGCLFVDLFGPLRSLPRNAARTIDGLQLTAYGHWVAARETARQLGFEDLTKSVRFDVAVGSLAPESIERLRKAIVAKNGLWFDYWRPMNWAFLAGDRTEQPSSRDHRDPKVRWFPDEMEKFLPLIHQADTRIKVAAAEIQIQ
jgi:hypothetical protein